MLLIFKTNLKD